MLQRLFEVLHRIALIFLSLVSLRQQEVPQPLVEPICLVEAIRDVAQRRMVLHFLLRLEVFLEDLDAGDDVVRSELKEIGKDEGTRDWAVRMRNFSL